MIIQQTVETVNGEGVRTGMKRAYDTEPPSQAAKALAEKITTLIIDSAVTFKDAIDAIDASEEMLEKETRPVRAES